MKRIFILQFILALFFVNSFGQAKNNTDSATDEKEIVRWMPVSQVNFKRPEIEAEFPGGDEKWFEFITKGLNQQIPIDNKAPKGEYTVTVWFLVSVNGSLKHFTAETTYGYGIEEEVIRLLKTSPKWKPAMDKGKNIGSYRSMAVSFVIK